jgi:transposase
VRHVIGRETSEQLDYIPAQIKVIEHVRLKYACRHCEATASPDGPQIVTADKPLLPIEKGLASPGLLSYVIVSKYGDHLPLYRLEGILKRHGIEIARSTMCDWAAQCATALEPLADLMRQRVLQSPVIHTDDTPVKVREPGLGRTRTGRFWVYVGDFDHPYTVFAYTPSRSRDGPVQFLTGWGQDEEVYLQADAFGGYDGIYAGDTGGRVTEAACWAHARRKFYDARQSDPGVSTQALACIRMLYDVEARAKKQASAKQTRPDDAKESATSIVPADLSAVPACASHADRPAQAGGESAARRAHARLVAVRYRLRREMAVPRLAEFRAWLESQQAERGGTVLPKSPIGQAIGYALNQWDALCVYTTDGRLDIDNNASENALRRVAVGRKNWLFAGSDNGGRTAATLFSLIATCQRHNVEPMAYLADVLDRIAATPVSQLDQLLPDRWNLTVR